MYCADNLIMQSEAKTTYEPIPQSGYAFGGLGVQAFMSIECVHILSKEDWQTFKQA